MKKLLLSSLILISTAYISVAQFNNLGYKNLKLNMSVQQVKQFLPIENDGASFMEMVEYEQVKFQLVFGALDNKGTKLLSITSYDPNAILESVPTKLIGKKLTDIQKILGNKLIDDENWGYIFSPTGKTNSTNRSLCQLTFRDDILISIKSILIPLED